MAFAALALGGCASLPTPSGIEPKLADYTQTERRLQELPPPAEPVIVAVYQMPDKTGQHKPNDDFSEYSRAVTQAGTEILIEALQEAGRGQWFVILDRTGLDSILRERQLIRSTREQYLGPDGKPLGPPPPLLYAPVLIEGAIVAYETNTYTGGAGARLLGIGGSTVYEHDRVTVSLRASSTQNGRLLRSVSATKEIYSQGLQAGVFSFVDFDELLEGELGYSVNEPPQLAVRRAIEKAVYALVIEGALSGAWTFADANAAHPLVQEYLEERDGGVSVSLPAPPSPGKLAPADDRSLVNEPSPSTDFSSELAKRLQEATEAGEAAGDRKREPNPDNFQPTPQGRRNDPPPQNRPES
ncbi:curlin [Qipengyuania sp. GH1]|uniref:CsgG/HfaB family protein n=1 Tax=Qipengyuania aestuarii TaxID=2867241 RepID=UPI001C8676DD|nr:CsgG/HfaB family protein [Qipengyuania aestuarii]MBX7535006.1 curlin [Qipengyuania aestuarii]